MPFASRHTSFNLFTLKMKTVFMLICKPLHLSIIIFFSTKIFCQLIQLLPPEVVEIPHEKILRLVSKSARVKGVRVESDSNGYYTGITCRMCKVNGRKHGQLQRVIRFV